MVVSPHPDDETLGAGGTLLKYWQQGHKLYWLNATNMKTEYKYSSKVVKSRSEEINKVMKSYRFDGLFDLALNPSKLDEYPLNSIIKQVAQVFTKIKPETVIMPFRADMHSDHRIIFQAVSACTKIFRYPYVKRILMMEILSETYPSLQGDPFVPNYYVDISAFLEKKIKIMRLYKSEIKPHPFPRSAQSIKALATLRGSEAGCVYAEAFMLLRQIE